MMTWSMKSVGWWFTISLGCLLFHIQLNSEAAERFGGVEIGAKGVKVSAVEIDESGPSPRLTVLELDKKTVDVTISRLKDKKFNPTIIGDVADVSKDFISALETILKVPNANIQVVASSGVQWVGNFGDLSAAILEKTGKVLTQVSPAEEASLTAIMLVPKERREQTIVLDIGSGNTKGAEFLDNSAALNRFATFSIPFGTTTLSTAIDESATTTNQTRSFNMAREVAQQKFGNVLRGQLPPSMANNKSKSALLSGGSIWAMVTLTRPEAALEKFPRITRADINTYLTLLEKAEGKYPVIDFERITDTAVRQAAQADYDRICGTPGKVAIFKPEELQAGAAILQQIGEILDLTNRPAYFDRKGVTAWITAKITPEKHRYLLPISLGRDESFIPLTSTAGTPQLRRYGGIEIGAKGVKFAVVEIDQNGSQVKLNIPEIDSATSNANISALKDKVLNPALIQDVVKAVNGFAETLKSKYEVPHENIQVVFSSGVPWVANNGDLRVAVKERTGIEVEEVTAAEEAKLHATTVLPESHFQLMTTIDIGSGSTKGGEFVAGPGNLAEFRHIAVLFGTKTLSSAIEQMIKTNGLSRAEAARKVASTNIGEPLRQQLRSQAGSVSNRNLLVSGGATWAFITIMKPEAAKFNYVAFNERDVSSYIDLLDKAAGNYPEIDFSQVADPEAKKIAQADYDKIRGAKGKEPIFKPEELRAAAALLFELSQQMEFEQRNVYFDRRAVTAWITAKITPDQYRHLLFGASGRALPAPKPVDRVAVAQQASGKSPSSIAVTAKDVTQPLDSQYNLSRLSLTSQCSGCGQMIGFSTVSYGVDGCQWSSHPYSTSSSQNRGPRFWYRPYARNCW